MFEQSLLTTQFNIMKTLYDKLGGEAAVTLAVDKFYEKVLKDDRIKDFFEDVDMEKQKVHQKLFLTYAFRGLPNYSGRSMRKAHQSLVEEKGLNDAHFDAVIELLADTLKELGIPDDLIAEVAQIGESTRKDVLNR